jgi:hypothetical protein
MSYLAHPRRSLTRYRRPKPALSGLFEFLEDLSVGVGSGGLISGDEVRDARAISCAADADQAVGSMDAQIADLERTWNPTGFFTADQMTTVIATTGNYMNAARDQMTAALQSVNIRDSGKEASAAAFDRAMESMQAASDKMNLFATAVTKARQTGTRAIDAPGLKVWVLQAMRASKELARAAAFANCNKNVFERFIRAVNDLLDRAIEIIKKIIGIVIAAGEKVIDVAGDFFGLLISMLKFAPYVLIAGGGLYLYKQYRQGRE